MQEGKTALQIAEEFGSHSVLRLLRDAVLRVQRGMPPCVYKEPELIRNALKTEIVSDPRFLGVSGKRRRSISCLTVSVAGAEDERWTRRLKGKR